MKLSDVDWNYLRGALRWIIAAGAACAIMVGASGYYLGEQRRAFEQQSGAREAAREEYLTAEEQGRLLQEYLARYQELQQRGVVGAERRLDWVEAVQESAQRLRLSKIQYQIMPREPYAPADLPSYPGLSVYASRMKLDMELMHEGDLAAVLDNLEHTAPGAVQVQSCRLRRLQDTLALDEARPNLAATCELRWFSIQAEAPAPVEGT